MTSLLHLPNSSPVHYEWLSAVIFVDDTSPISLSRLLELNIDPNVDEAMAGRLPEFLVPMGSTSRPKPWRNSEEAIRDLSLRHEYCHYLQDIATGVGHWDDITLSTNFSSLISMYSEIQDWTGIEHLRSESTLEIIKKFQFFVPSDIEEKRKSLRAQFLERRKIAHLARPGDFRHLGLANILEADAIAEVLLHSLDVLDQDNSVSEIMFSEDVEHLWNPLVMPAAYCAVFSDFKTVALSGLSDSFIKNPENMIRIFRFLANLLQQMTDIALAYPNQTFISKLSDDEKMYFDPVVKFYTLLKAFHQMSRTAGEKMQAWLAGNGTDFQDALLTDSEFRNIYPNRPEIYRGWEATLNDSAKKNLITRARKLNASRRCRESISIRRTPIATDIAPSGGVWWWNSRQLPQAEFLGDIEAAMDMPRARADLLVRISDIRVLDLLCNGKAISCPFAGKGSCKGEVQACGDIQDPQAFPIADCFLRERFGVLVR